MIAAGRWVGSALARLFQIVPLLLRISAFLIRRCDPSGQNTHLATVLCLASVQRQPDFCSA